MAIKSIQQFAVRTAFKNEKSALNTLALMKEYGYEGIELCSYLLYKLPLAIRLMTSLAGMGIGRSGKLDWEKLIKESELKVISIHDDIGSLENHPQKSIDLARKFNTNTLVITGMHKFDYSSNSTVIDLANRLNKIGELLYKNDIRLLYHNHNCELLKVTNEKTAFQLLVEHTNPKYVNFEFDSYWLAEAGADVIGMMDFLGKRMKLFHINDRGFRPKGKHGSIFKSNSIELGFGNLPLKKFVQKALEYDVDSIILETHTNWINNSPIDSFKLSSKFMNEFIV